VFNAICEVCVIDLELKLLDARWGFGEGIRGWGLHGDLILFLGKLKTPLIPVHLSGTKGGPFVSHHQSRLDLRDLSLVEWEALVRAFSPYSTLESGLKVFRRRGPKSLRMTPTFCPGWYYQPGLK
jgi:hypothetical protein